MADSPIYPVEVSWSDEDEGYIAVVPDLPGCSAWGRSEGKALKELRVAIELWIAAAKAAGNPVPEPSRPAKLSEYSGKFVVRVPRQLHQSLARAARRGGVSLNQYGLHLLSGR